MLLSKPSTNEGFFVSCENYCKHVLFLAAVFLCPHPRWRQCIFLIPLIYGIVVDLFKMPKLWHTVSYFLIFVGTLHVFHFSQVRENLWTGAKNSGRLSHCYGELLSFLFLLRMLNENLGQNQLWLWSIRPTVHLVRYSLFQTMVARHGLAPWYRQVPLGSSKTCHELPLPCNLSSASGSHTSSACWCFIFIYPGL